MRIYHGTTKQIQVCGEDSEESSTPDGSPAHNISLQIEVCE